MNPHGQPHRFARGRAHLWLLLLLHLMVPCVTFSQSSVPSPAATLTSAIEIKRLDPDQARLGRPVRLRGVVLYYNQLDFVDLIIHDGTAGIYLADTADKGFRAQPGDLIEVEGATGAGDYAPVVQAKTLRRVGTAPLPEPRVTSYEQLVSLAGDAEWVQIRGIVRAVSPSRRPVPGESQIDIMTSGGRLNARVQNYDLGRILALVDSEVVLTGVCTPVFNRRRQLLDVRLSVPTRQQVEVVQPAPADPFAAPTRHINRLRQYDPGSTSGHRVKVRGVVTLVDNAHSLFIRDATQGLRVDVARWATVAVGDEVEALGFIARGGYSPKLEDATYRRTGVTHPVLPVAIGIEVARQGSHDGDLVQMEGVLLDWIPDPAEHLLLLQNGDVVFRAHLPRSGGAITPFAAGTRVRATGICLAELGAPRSHPQTFYLQLRSAEDLRVLQSSPWWNARRLWSALGALSLALVAGSIWVVLLRRQVAAQTALIGKKIHQEAILNERHRMAREIHDTLVQSFAAISLQLEAIRDKLGLGDPARVARHLQIAHRLARESLTDARRSVWALHNMTDAAPNLAASLAANCKSIIDGTGIENSIAIEGEVPSLPAEVENNLLYIGREAVINSVKHAAPRRIDLTLQREPRALRVIVRDDGCGFERTGVGRGTQEGGFGMISMEERAQQISAHLQIESRRGVGTTVCVTVPLDGV